MILLRANNKKDLSPNPVYWPLPSLVCWLSCFIRACKFHHSQPCGQMEDKKRQAVRVRGEGSMWGGIWMEMCPESSSSDPRHFGPRFPPVLEPLSRSFSQIQIGPTLSPKLNNESITRRRLKLRTASLSLVNRRGSVSRRGSWHWVCQGNSCGSIFRSYCSGLTGGLQL